DEEESRSADPLDRRDFELARTLLHFDVGRAKPHRALMRGLGVLDPERHCTSAGAMVARILLGVGARLGVDDEVAVALFVQRDVLALVPRNLGATHPGEQGA